MKLTSGAYASDCLVLQQAADLLVLCKETHFAMCKQLPHDLRL
jgi:hypothetical protein